MTIDGLPVGLNKEAFAQALAAGLAAYRAAVGGVAPVADAGGWFATAWEDPGHSGKIDIRFRNGTSSYDCRPDGWVWEDRGADYDITHYRVRP